MDTGTELEVRFIVPQAARAALAEEIARGTTTFERRTLAAIYLDTEDRRLARAGIAWRLRREGRRWIQTAKATGNSALERLEHEVIRPDATPDATGHAGTAVGERLLPVLAAALAKGLAVEVRFQTRIRRDVRRIRTRGAMVEVSFDEGRLIAAEASQRVREVEFELVSGSASAMLTLAERWRKRFGLILEPRSKSERGDRLAEGAAHPPVRKGRAPEYPRQATVLAAFGAVVDECLEQI
ncbi:MAG: inorganic triphosphatase, partial [Burkholderiaceae bacterium]